MGREKKMQISSSRRETASENNHSSKKSVGCMSGIFQLLSRHHHSHSRKRLPSAGRKDKSVSLTSKSTPPPEKITSLPPEKDGERVESSCTMTPEKAVPVKELRRQSCDTPRSPTLPSEIRRSSSVEMLDSPRRPTALVARLMGLDDIPVSSPDSTAEKRRKLLGALEKCDEDLKSLKRLLDAIRVAESRRKAVEAIVDSSREEVLKVEVVKGRAGKNDLDNGDSSMEVNKSLEVNSEQPSPVSVLDTISSPRSSHSNRSENAKESGSSVTAVRSRIPEPSRLGAIFSGEHKKKMPAAADESCTSLFRGMTIEGLPRVMDLWWAKRGMEEGGRRRRWRGRRSQAMVESVGEVWEDGVWEERWEFGRVGVGLERGIIGDLVEEFVREMLGCHYKVLISQGNCKRRLCF